MEASYEVFHNKSSRNQENLHGVAANPYGIWPSMGFTEEIREIVKAEIKARGESANSFAEKCGVEQGSMSLFLRGKGLQLKTITKIIDYIGLKVIRPGEVLSSDGTLISPELVDIDQVIKSMRKVHADECSIMDTVAAAAARQAEETRASAKKKPPSPNGRDEAAA